MDFLKLKRSRKICKKPWSTDNVAKISFILGLFARCNKIGRGLIVRVELNYLILKKY